MRSRWSWLGGAALLAAVLWHTGTEPVVEGLRSLNAATLLLGALLAVPTTVACAWRWRLVARGLGTELTLGTAVAACYRSQLLNSSLPAGVVGDVLRGVDHGRSSGDTGRGLRAVVWERTAGQVVLVALTALVVALQPSPFRSPWWLVPAGVAVVAVVAGRRRLRDRVGGRAVATVRSDLRLLRVARCWPGVALGSVVAVAGHVATYVLAARAVGVTAPLVTLAPLVLVVLVAAGLPTNVAGWGPREGMAAWACAAGGLGAEQGVASAVAYGAMVLVACLPGLVPLVAGSAARRRGSPPRPAVHAERARG